MRRTYLQECHSCEEPVIASAAKQPRGVRCPHLTQSWRYIVTILIALTLCASVSFADTTWVAGTVSGVWSREGNPYLVTDTLTIPHDSTLNILPGVQIYFQNQHIRRTPINVLGRLQAIGEEGDSIYFYSGQSGFGGINNLNTLRTEIRMQYCVVDSLHECIRSEQGLLVLSHSRICGCQHEYANIIVCSESIDTVQYCNLIGGDVHFSRGGPSVFQYNQGRDFTPTWQQMAPIIGNQLHTLFLDESSWMEVYDNELEGLSIWRGSAYIHNNNIQGLFNPGQSVVTFENNVVERISIFESQGTFRGNVIYDWSNFGCIDLSGSYSVTIERNLLFTERQGIEIMGGDYNLIRNNTVVFGEKGVYSIYTGDHNQVINNIFVGDGVNCTGIYSSGQDPFAIQYNDFYNMTSVTYGCQLGPGNILLDPCFRAGNPYDYQLQANSPCIDAGDPTSLRDPDNTRADMGCYFFDHRIDNPPAIISPVVVNVQRGTSLRYIAQATDDYGSLSFGFWNLPAWLYRVPELMDFQQKTAVVSGRVPQGQQNFTFGVWVQDGSAQRDSQMVSVLVSPYTILQGNVTGVLSLANSPYLVVQDVVVPVGDSLTIEPGVEIRFQWEPVEDLRHRIIVRGELRAMGTPEDTIRFVPEFGDSILNAWRGIWYVGSSQDTARIRYAYFKNGLYAVVVDSQAVAILKHLYILDTYFGVWVLDNSYARIDSCDFYSFPETYHCSIFVDSAFAEVSDCYSEFVSTNESGTHVELYLNAIGSIHGCTFIQGEDIAFDYSSSGSFYRNKVINIGNGVGIYNSSSGLIANNIFSGNGGLILAGADSTLITNNLFYHNGTSIEIVAPDNQHVKNNIFLGNGQAIHAIGTPVPFNNISYKDFYENDSNFVNSNPDSTNLYLNPIFQDTINFQLSAGSPCIDAGDPDQFFNDVDSTRNDIGCWGGPWGESYLYQPVLAAETSKPIPTEFALLPPYPNPFNSVLVIPFTIPVQKEVIINIYNILGQKVQEYTFPPLSPGVHRVVWNSGSCASGLYIIQLTSENKEFNQKVLLLK